MASYRADDIYFDRAKIVLNLFGILPSATESVLYKLYRYVMVITQYMFLAFQVYYMGLVWGDLDEVSDASYLLFTQASLCFKVSVFLLNFKNFEEIVAMMNCETFKPQSEQHEMLVRREARTIRRLMLGFMAFSQLTCGLWALPPLFENAESRAFPFKMWMPVDAQRSPHFELGYAFQYGTICVSAFMYFGVDSVALGALMFARAQLHIIHRNILHIGTAITKAEHVSSVDEHTGYQKLVECIVHHQAVITFVRAVEGTYHTYLFFQLSGSVGILCMSCLRLLAVEWRSVQFVSMVSYLVAMLTQLYVCCWCGHELTAQSESLPTAVWGLAGASGARLGRLATFAMMRMQRPLVFRLGHYISLSRQTFVTVLRTSYSYFAFLNQANNKK